MVQRAGCKSHLLIECGCHGCVRFNRENVAPAAACKSFVVTPFQRAKTLGGAALNIGSSRPSPEVPAPDTSNQEMMRMTVQNAHNEAQVIELRMRAAPLEVGLLTHKVKLRYVYLAIMSTNIYQTHCT